MTAAGAAAAASGQREREATFTQPKRRRTPGDWTRTAVLTSLFVAIILAFLAPLAYSGLTSLKTPQQITQPNAPILPSDPATFEWNGKDYKVYFVPLADGTTKELALVKPGRRQSEFVDPANPDAGTIVWDGSWRTLQQPWELAPGAWTFQFFEGDRKLAEFSFTVSGDAVVPETTEPSCFQLSS